MNASTKRLALAGVAGVAVMALIAGGTFALFRSSANAGGTYASGTVTLNNVSGESWDFQNLAPWWGIFWSDHHEWQVAYTGSLDAWVGLDALLTGDLAACDGGTSFDMWIASNYHPSWTIFSGNGSGVTNAMPTYVTNGANITYYMWPTLWPNATDDCQGKKATLQMTAHAVQAYRNSTFTGPVMWDANSISSIDPAAIVQDLSSVSSAFANAHPSTAPNQTKNLSDQHRN